MMYVIISGAMMMMPPMTPSKKRRMELCEQSGAMDRSAVAARQHAGFCALRQLRTSGILPRARFSVRLPAQLRNDCHALCGAADCRKKVQCAVRIFHDVPVK
jgi:hypothetical protein